MSSVNYTYCHVCREYVPLWYPGALSFLRAHTSCTSEQKKRHILNGVEVLVVGEPPPAPAVSFGENPPEGYSCDITWMEELAYSVKPPIDRLT